MGHPPFFGDGLATLWDSIFWVAKAVAIVAIAYFLYQAAIRRRHAALNIGAHWWVLFTLLGGIWTLLIYWLMERSTLSAYAGEDPPELPRPDIPSAKEQTAP
jgi:hypothetical protein